MENLKEVSTQDLRKELELRGFQTFSLWHLQDVTQNYNCDNIVAMGVLKDALSNDWVTEQIFEAIDQVATDIYNLDYKWNEIES
jgi:hypothetical protein